VLPVDRATVPAQVVAGVTLAALAIPEVMGYTSIAGMPVITGLYTILLPMLAFAIFGSSRHLVVGADSATAAVMAAGLAGLAATGSSEYTALAGMLAFLTAAFLLLARVARLGFLADFLSRTVLIGFLTGVGIQVACGQVGGILGIPEGKGIDLAGDTYSGTIGKLISTLENLSDTSLTTVAVSVTVIVVILGAKFVTTKIPGALIAVIGSIVVSYAADLASHGVGVLGPVPGGLPSIGFPDVGLSEIPALVGTAVSIFVLVLAQSAATSRAYAAKYDDAFDENVDLDGLAAANVFAGLSGTFVVNGSPTKTQMVDGAGGRSQVAQIATGAVVLIVLLFLTKPLQYMPQAVLSSVVLLIGIELVDLAGMRKVLRARPDEFVVATLTAATVVLVGVEQGIIVAIVASIIDHIRRSYRPATDVIAPGDDGSWHHIDPTPDARSVPGMVVYRFAASIYYANANHLLEDAGSFVGPDAGSDLRWFCLDGAALADIDYTGAQTLRQLHGQLAEHGVRLVVAELMHEVREELPRLGIDDILGGDAIFDTVPDAVAAFQRGPGPSATAPPEPPTGG
jgi:high affinity sulfate transporter 1